jgi:hypothetical protein
MRKNYLNNLVIPAILVVVVLYIVFMLKKEGFQTASASRVNNVSGTTKCQEVYFILDQLANFYFNWGGVSLDASNNLVSANSVFNTHKISFHQLVGRNPTYNDISTYRSASIDGNLNYSPAWGTTCRKLSLDNCNKRYDALDKIARTSNDKVRITNIAAFKTIMGRDPRQEEWVNRNTFRYIGCMKP